MLDDHEVVCICNDLCRLSITNVLYDVQYDSVQPMSFGKCLLFFASITCPKNIGLCVHASDDVVCCCLITLARYAETRFDALRT